MESQTMECVICLDNIIEEGKIDSCTHTFCFQCIINWSKVTNLCPVCKKEFKKVKSIGDNPNNNNLNIDTNNKSVNNSSTNKSVKEVKIKRKIQKVAYEDTGLATTDEFMTGLVFPFYVDDHESDLIEQILFSVYAEMNRPSNNHSSNSSMYPRIANPPRITRRDMPLRSRQDVHSFISPNEDAPEWIDYEQTRTSGRDSLRSRRDGHSLISPNDHETEWLIHDQPRTSTRRPNVNSRLRSSLVNNRLRPPPNVTNQEQRSIRNNSSNSRNLPIFNSGSSSTSGRLTKRPRRDSDVAEIICLSDSDDDIMEIIDNKKSNKRKVIVISDDEDDSSGATSADDVSQNKSTMLITK
uniref:RING-type domain-containing protein n=1 Tax=Chromulina nebulosa TaxID=96789 RepID=A0A7S0XGF1_9STRA|mmetsp:Transcript_3687/g.3290  ORF Transcript_3687/g.3290 Transcript_3687/m.3290 type:complete len:353 (+) Transcript_3687:11-1069(+)